MCHAAHSHRNALSAIRWVNSGTECCAFNTLGVAHLIASLLALLYSDERKAKVTEEGRRKERSKVVMLTGYAGQLLGRVWVRYALMVVVTLLMAGAFSLGLADEASATHGTGTSGWVCYNAWDFQHRWACYYYSYWTHLWYGPLYPYG
jgi:hypothetical protein